VIWYLNYTLSYCNNWSLDNLITVNFDKTKENVFHRPSARPALSCPFVGIDRVVSAMLLGVTFSQLSFDEHVRNILTSLKAIA